MRKSALDHIHKAVRDSHGFFPDIDLNDYLRPSHEESRVLVREVDDAMEIAVLLNSKILAEIDHLDLPADLDLSRFGSLAVAIEELSHFNSLVWQATQNGTSTLLELEVQAEVDKFAIVLDWLELKNQQELSDQFFDSIFSECKVGHWVDAEGKMVYEEAHSIARGLCRQLLKAQYSEESRKKRLADFFRASGTRKLSFSF